MFVQTGVDLIRISRIQKAVERLGDPFLNRIWTAAEQVECLTGDRSYSQQTFASLAARFAAKEAVAKALGTGFGPAGVSWTDISTTKDRTGRPQVRLIGGAKRRYRTLGGTSIAISMTHEGGLAMAQCCLLHREPYHDAYA